MKKIILLFLCALFIYENVAWSQYHTEATFEPLTGASTSSNSRAPQGSQRYIRTAYLITAAEMSAAGIPSGKSFTSIGFSYSTAQSVATSGSFKVYFKNTTDLTNSLGTTWGTGTGQTIEGMTLACDNTITIPAATGTFDHLFSGGTTFTYTGGGLYVAFEYQNASGTISANNVAFCNTNLTNGLINAFSTTSMPTTLSNTSSFRPYTRLGLVLPNDAGVQAIYTLGKLPTSGANPHTISAYIRNFGDNLLLNVTASLNVTGANTYSNSKVIDSIIPGSGKLVTFNSFSPTNIGTNTITVSVPSDDNAANNSRSVSQQVTTTTYSTAYDTVTSAGVGSNTAAIDIATIFRCSAANGINSIKVNFSSSGQPYVIKIYNVNSDTPQNVLYTSATLTTAAGPNTIPISPTVGITGDFAISVSQTGTTNMGLSFESETPLRSNVFLAKSPSGTNTWGALSSPFKIMVDANLATVVPVTLTTFTGVKEGNRNTLNWSTANETNNKAFELQRSANGEKFSSIATINSKAENGNSSAVLSYSYNDEKPLVGTNYYRLRQLDKDGRESFSSIVVLKSAFITKAEITRVYPNPVAEQLNVVINTANSEKVNIRITDLVGKTIAEKMLQTNQGDNNIQFNTSALARGTYLIKIFSSNESEMGIQKFIKQ
jgi:hypothetical protein